MQAKKRTQVLFAMLMLGIISLFAAKGFARADAPVNAVPLALNGTYSVDTVLYDEDKEAGTAAHHEDFYLISIPTDGSFEFRIMSYTGKSISYGLYNADMSKNFLTGCGNYVSGGTATSPVTKSIVSPVSAGTYYLKISTDGVGTDDNNKPIQGRYLLFGGFTTYGATDAGAYSYDQPLGYAIGSEVIGALTVTDTEDWFKFTCNGGKYNFNVMNYGKSSLSFQISNYDLSKSLLSSSVGSMGEGDTSPRVYSKEDFQLEAGTYYIKFTGGNGKYKFTLSGKATKVKLKCKVTAKKNKKKVTVKTTPYATVKVKYAGKTYKRVAGANGKVTIKLSKKLKKGKKIRVTITKTGCSKISKKIAVK